jgi:tetratricopeptide (TPR) repeat protein
MRNMSKSSTKRIEKSHSFQTKTKDLTSDSRLDDLEEPSEEMQNSKYYEHVATSNVDFPEKNMVLNQALKIINQGLAFAPKDRNLLITRSYILFYLHNFYDALCDIDAVIDIERASSGEEEPNPSDLLHKGRCHACLSMFKEAIVDFSKVIELDEDQFDAYLYRGKCSYLIGDTSQSFLDFQRLILLQPKNPMVHAYAGNLLMTTGSYEDA